VLELCRDCVNFHPSLLPKNRGSLTQFWSIFEGDAVSGVTCHHMVEEFDAGRILCREPVRIAADETALSLNHKIALAVETCFVNVLSVFLKAGQLKEGESWDVEQFPYHYKQIPNDGVIDPDWPDDKVERFIRAMYFPPLTPAKFRSADGELHAAPAPPPKVATPKAEVRTVRGSGGQ
ncbi:arnA, partial [Symbiodinium sp. KB8]